MCLIKKGAKWHRKGSFNAQHIVVILSHKPNSTVQLPQKEHKLGTEAAINNLGKVLEPKEGNIFHWGHIRLAFLFSGDSACNGKLFQAPFCVCGGGGGEG